MLHIFSVPRETSRAHGASTHAISLLLRFSASARTAHCRAVLGVVRVQYTLSGHPLKTSRGRRRPPSPATGQTHCAQTRRAFAGHRLRASLLSLRSISALSLSRRRCLPWQGAALRLAVGLACGAPLGAPVGVVLGGGRGLDGARLGVEEEVGRVEVLRALRARPGARVLSLRVLSLGAR